MNRNQHKKSLEVNQVKIAFSRKTITPYGGMTALVAKFLEVIDFRSWVNVNIPIDERSNNGKGIYEKILAQFLTILSGGFRFSHLSWWGYGLDALCSTFGVSWFPKAASSLTRFWNKINVQAKAEKLGDAARSLATTILGWEELSRDNLNFDSSQVGWAIVLPIILLIRNNP